jgi:hypothetical protein
MGVEMEFVIGPVIAGVVAFFVFQDAVNWRNEEIAVLGQSSVSPGMWSFGVFMIMIIFLPIYLIQRSSAKGRLMRVCPWCSQRIAIRTRVCPFCQRDVGTGADAMAASPAIPAPPTVRVPAGWLADPMGEHELRYWDGAGWTSHVHDYAVSAPLEAPAPE